MKLRTAAAIPLGAILTTAACGTNDPGSSGGSGHWTSSTVVANAATCYVPLAVGHGIFIDTAALVVPRLATGGSGRALLVWTECPTPGDDGRPPRNAVVVAASSE